MSGKFQFAIDRGGTFTDVWARCPNGRTEVMKLLSVDPSNYDDAPREGIRRILQQETGELHPSEEPLDTSRIDWIRMGTTVATNALLERKGERTALAITSGFKDLLYIGNQARPNIFDLEIVTPEMIYEEIIEVDERIVLQQDSCQLPKPDDIQVVEGITGEKVQVQKRIDEPRLRLDLERVFSKGFRSLAVVLIHSYIFDGHEKEVARIAKQVGFTHVSTSSHVMPMVRMVPRGFTACADAYLTPCIKDYLQSFAAGFKSNLDGVKVLFMQSDGGLTSMDNFNGARAILSGPAGGVVGYALTTYSKETKSPVIGFDMGGTSTDVSRYSGEYEHVFETTTAGISIQAPQLDINTVAAGGGSRLFFRSGMFVVGPDSAGAHPGPTCYRKGGPLCVTDANLILGRLLPELFPNIFGPNENEALDKKTCVEQFEKLTQEINSFKAEGETMTIEEVAIGFIQVANETMCRPIRNLTQAKGHDTSRHVLACFGGAGGQHACAIARSLGMTTVFIHKYSGILSAYGMALADVVYERQEPCAWTYHKDNFTDIDAKLTNLTDNCIVALQEQGFHKNQIFTEPFLHLRYKNTDCALMCSPTPGINCPKFGDFETAFTDRYHREFGFIIPGRDIIIDDIRVRGVGKTLAQENIQLPSSSNFPKPDKVTSCYFEGGYQDTGVFLLNKLCNGQIIVGPAILIEKNSTVLVEPNCMATITPSGDINIQIGSGKVKEIGTALDMIQLSIFSHRFMSTAEQMGRILQRTAISTNIKERLDFSCAVFGDDGGLVANAPHIPVHLGAMQETVQYQIKYLGDDIHDGDMILSNHPCAGGSHLPDLTVITPVFHKGVKKPVFFVASRGHHADIGGKTPGSMPPFSNHINDEGAVFWSFKLVKNGVFQEDAVVEVFMAPGKIPGNSGSRNLHDNLSDLRAQVAANQKGVILIEKLIAEYSLCVVQAYMKHIQNTAEVAIADMFRQIGKQTREHTGQTQLKAVDFMDDGTPLQLTVDIDTDQGTAVFDFAGTGHEVHGNKNAPRAITVSAIIYCLRCMVGHDIPLNQGCLKPVKIIVPPGCILDPSENAAVVGGNVQTSQRVVDVIFKTFRVCAASQGCMNNMTFGDDDVGYYETVAGGHGAGPGWDGRGGVHTHMTNTRITDPEILERRYPVILQRFQLNPDSGGHGKWTGGDGVIRDILFRRPLTMSILTERRSFQPYGMAGGKPGKRGVNLLRHKNGLVINLGGKNLIDVVAGDCLCTFTPGGGGYGVEDDENMEPSQPKKRMNKQRERAFHGQGSLYAFKAAQEQA